MHSEPNLSLVATAPTVYGIETKDRCRIHRYLSLVATAPTVYGIETLLFHFETLQ